MRQAAVLHALICATLLTACQAPQPAVRQDSGKGALPGDLTQRYVHQIVRDLRDSLNSKDVPGFMKHVSEGFYKGRSRLQKNLEESFAAAGAVSVEAQIVEIDEEDLRISAVVRWTRSDKTPLGETVDDAGQTRLIFHKVDTLSLVDFREGSLFGISGF
jgi:hypothetical protein